MMAARSGSTGGLALPQQGRAAMIATAMPSQKRRPGRPTIRTQETADAICEGLFYGKSLYQVLSKPGMPSYAAVCRWLVADAAFREQYAHAREGQEVFLVDTVCETATLKQLHALDRRIAQLRPKKYHW